jgi:hypothetical protein
MLTKNIDSSVCTSLTNGMTAFRARQELATMVILKPWSLGKDGT